MQTKQYKYTDVELTSYWDKCSNIKRIIGMKENEVFSILYDRHCTRVYNYCNKKIGYDEPRSDDILQETFIAFYNKLKSGLICDSVPAFLIGIARNLCLNFINREQKRKVSLNENEFHLKIEELMDSQKSNVENDELFGMLVSALDMLNDEMKEAFELREFQGMKYKDIAEICCVPIGTAKDRVYRAHEKIKKLLSPYIEDINRNF